MGKRLRCALCALVWLASDHAAQAATITPSGIFRPEGARSYLLVVPDRPAPGKLPLVILLHGHGGSAAQLLGKRQGAAPLSEWLRIADREGLLLAVPDGERGGDGRLGWNDCRADAGSNPKSDDVGLIDAIIDREIRAHDADPARIFVMGMSNGGMMAFRMALERGERLAGFAAVGASMAGQNQCAVPTAAVTALIAAGTADPLVPFGGGDVGFAYGASRGEVIGVEQAVEAWRRIDGLSGPAAEVFEFEHRDPKDPTRAVRTVWGRDASQPQVEFVRIEQGGHVEPSIHERVGRFYARLVGSQNGDVEIAEEAWTLFRNKRRRGPD